MSRAIAYTVAAATLLATGCGLGLTEERSGGADNLPTLGAGPYQRLEPVEETPINEPYVFESLRESFEDPSALPRDGGGFRLWFGHLDLSQDAPASEIWYAELAVLGELAVVGPEPVLTASDAWEAGRVAAPSVVELGGGRLAMFYEAGDPAAPAIGRADSDDGGRSWRKHADNPVLAGFGSPGAAQLDGEWLLYATRPDAPGIFRADSADGVAWAPTATPVLSARADTEDAFDRYGVGDPTGLAFRSVAGQVYYGVVFNGAAGPDDDADVAVGYAGSFDTDSWERYQGIDPVLNARDVPVEGPTVVLEPTRATMFFSEVRAGRGKISVAVHP